MLESSPRHIAIFLASSTFLLSSCGERKEPQSQDAGSPIQGATGVWDHSRWLELLPNYPVGHKISNEDFAALDSTLGRERPDSRTLLLGSQPLSPEVLHSLLVINETYFLGVPKLYQQAETILNRKRNQSGHLYNVVNADVATLLADSEFRSKMEEVYGRETYDCKEVSVTLLMALLLRSNQTGLTQAPFDVRFVTGICFDPHYAPEGVGHNWVEFQGEVLDFAIQEDNSMSITPMSQGEYVPIVWRNIRVNLADMHIEPELRVIVSLDSALRTRAPE